MSELIYCDQCGEKISPTLVSSRDRPDVRLACECYVFDEFIGGTDIAALTLPDRWVEGDE